MQTQEKSKESWHHLITIDELDGLKRKVNVLYDSEGVKNTFEEAASLVGKNVQIKGFRKGKAPLALVKKVCEERIQDAVKSILSQRGYLHACNEHKLFVLKEPEFNNVKFNPDGSFSCEILVEVRPDINPTGYLGLILEKDPVDRDQLFNQILDELKSSHLTDVPLEEIEDGAIALIDFSVEVEGEEITKGDAQPFTIAKGQEPPFGENLIGMKVGEERDEVTVLPEESKEYAGKEAKVHIKLGSAIRREQPSDDELVEKTQSPSFEDLMSAIKSRAEHTATHMEKQQLEEKIVDKLIEMHSFEIPKDWIVDERNHAIRSLGFAEEPDKDTIEYMDKMAERNIRRTFVFDAIYRDEPAIAVKKEDLERFIEEEAKRAKVSTLVVKKELEEKKMIDSVVASLKHRKVMDLVLSQAQIQEKQEVLSDEAPETQSFDVPETPM